MHTQAVPSQASPESMPMLGRADLMPIDIASDEYDVLRQIEAIQLDIRRKLWINPRARIDELHASGQAKCQGYAIAGSEALETAGIEHFIGYINVHATLMVPAGDRLWMIDMGVPKFNQPIGNIQRDSRNDAHITVGHKILCHHDMQAARSIIRLNGREVMLDSSVDASIAIAQHTWLSSRPGKSESSYYDPSRIKDFQNLIVSIFDSATGRKVAYNDAKFNEHCNDGDYESAAFHAIEMHGMFPNIDLRTNPGKRTKTVVRNLAAAGNFGLAQEVASAFLASFKGIDDTRVTEYEADFIRYIAQYSGRKTLANYALRLYNSVVDRERAHQSTIRAKIDVTKPLLQLGQQPQEI